MKKVLEALADLQVKMPIQTIVIVLVIALLLALIIYLTYKNTYTGVLYNARFNLSIVMITMITTIVMIVIGSNISVSLGMVGALSIVRFRTAVKDPRDTAFIFWGIVVGLACGTQNYYVAIIGSIFVSGMLFAFKKFITGDDRYVIVIKGKGFAIDTVNKILKKETKSFAIKSQFVKDDVVELIYDAKINGKSDSLLGSIYQINGVSSASVVTCNTDIMG